MFKEKSFKTKTDGVWKYTDRTETHVVPINIKVECDICDNFVPRENIEPGNLLNLQDGDYGLCVRKDPYVKIITTSNRSIKNCKSF